MQRREKMQRETTKMQRNEIKINLGPISAVGR